MYVPIILGTARKGRYSRMAADYFLKEVKQNYKELETEIIDVKDYFQGFTDDKKDSEVVQRFSEKIIKADGLIIITPEYNHGYPGELKLLLDMLYKEYARKPVGICGVSKGAFGGSRAVEQLKQMAIEFHMTPIREAVYFSFVQSLFNEDGSIKDESYSEKISKFMQEFLWYAKVLKKGREEDIDNLPLI